MRRSSGAVSRHGNERLVQSGVKPPSSPGTVVPASGVPAAATSSHTPATRPSKAARSRLEKLLSRSSSTRTHCSASTRSPSCLRPSTIPSIPRFEEGEAAFERGFSLVWERIQYTIEGPAQIDETDQKCSGYKGQTPPRDSLSRGGPGERGRSRWERAPGDTMMLIRACRDVLQVIRAEPGA